MNYFCCDQRRRKLLKESELNGIDFLEVLDHDAPSRERRQKTLFVHLFKTPDPSPGKENIRIDCGERIRGITVTEVTQRTGSAANVLEVEVDKAGDFSIYTLRLVTDASHDNPPANFDPLFSAVEFSFKAEQFSDFDCRRERICPPTVQAQPEIDYLAKDYATFRRLMLDRMALLMPQWTERRSADLGIALVEMLAYVADHLSYEQDAVATEAYLGTARRRVSVRRHARLVDYFMHDGCNARTWVQVFVKGTGARFLPKGCPLLSRVDQQPRRIATESLLNALKQQPVVFETMHDALLFEAHNELDFYTWGDGRCCLPRGATCATLLDDPKNRLRLRRDDVLIFEERVGPNSGKEVEADPARRHAVRLTRVNPEAVSVLNDKKTEIDRTPGEVKYDNLPKPEQAVVEIEWAPEDALPFALCISSVADKKHGGKPVERVSVAHGNIVLADHGSTIENEPLGKVSAAASYRPPKSGDDRCGEREHIPVPARFRPSLQKRPLTYAAGFNPAASATDAMHGATRDLLPSITLSSRSDSDEKEWSPQRDLLGSGVAPHFVVEIESDGTAYLRFGDDENGRRPTRETEFFARYRIGNGVSGNIGAEALCHIVSADSKIVGVRNPMPARGGVEPESIEDVRQRAPSAFRTQQRAVTETDYAEVVQRDSRVQRAAATFRWTGSWHTAFLTVDRFGGLPLDKDFEKEIAADVNRFRMAGHDFEIDEPRFVALEIEMRVLAMPGYFRSDVKSALLDLLSNRVLPDGRRGLFHPDNFTFGQSVYLSPLYAAAHSTPGVASTHITKFKRRDSSDNSTADRGFLTFGRLEIARLDNDPNFAERGVFRLTVGGGK